MTCGRRGGAKGRSSVAQRLRVDEEFSLREDADEGQGEEEAQDVQQLLHQAPNLLSTINNGLTELTTHQNPPRHRFLLLLLHTATGKRSSPTGEHRRGGA